MTDDGLAVSPPPCATTMIRDCARPCSVAIAADGTCYVAVSDRRDGAHCLVAIDGDHTVRVVAGVHADRGHADGAGRDARFGVIYDLAAAADGRVFIADGNRVRVFDPVTGEVATVAGARHRGCRDGPGEEALFYTIRGIAVDAHGTVYVSDFGNNRVRRIDRVVVENVEGNSRTTLRWHVSTVAGRADCVADCVVREEAADESGAATLGVPASPYLNCPYSLALDDRRGRLFVGTGDDLLVSIAVPSHAARRRDRIFPILLVFWLADRRRAHLRDEPPPPGDAGRRVWQVLHWLSTTRANAVLLPRILEFAY